MDSEVQRNLRDSSYNERHEQLKNAENILGVEYLGSVKLSTFKNNESYKALKLIKDSGCAGMEVGDASISEKHCNFFVNKGNAKSKDLEELITQVKKKVFEKTGINLELELQIIGEKW